MKMFYNLGPRNNTLTNIKRPNSSFLRIFSFGWKANNVCFVAVYLFSQHFSQFDLSDQFGPMKH